MCSLTVTDFQLNNKYIQKRKHHLFKPHLRKIKSILIHEYQHKSTRVNTSLTRVNTSLTWVNTNQHESDTSLTKVNTSPTQVNTNQYKLKSVPVIRHQTSTCILKIRVSTSRKHFNNSIKIAAESVLSPAIRTLLHMSILTNITKILKQSFKIKKSNPRNFIIS